VSVTYESHTQVLQTHGCYTSVQTHGCNTRDADTPPMTQVTHNTISPPMTQVSEKKRRDQTLKEEKAEKLETRKKPELNKKSEFNQLELLVK